MADGPPSRYGATVQPRAAVIGSGPNGLAGAVTLARGGVAVEVYEAASVAGGGCRTAELTLPGFTHDVCAAAHPWAAASPFFATVDLEARGVKFLHAPVVFAHPLDGGRAGAVYRSVSRTAEALGPDAGRYQRTFGPLAGHLDDMVPALLGPPRRLTARALAASRVVLPGLLPASVLARQFGTEEARALLAGAAAHSALPLGAPLTGVFGLLFMALGHSHGWPLVEGGSKALPDALVAELVSLGGRVHLGCPVADLAQVAPADVVLADLSPGALAGVAGDRLGVRYARALRRFRHGPGACKVDWALAGPVPWQAEVCRQAGTVHVGGTFEEVAASEAEVAAGRHPRRPFCLVVQPGVVDPGRAPPGMQTLWAYCHVPNGSLYDMADRIQAQVERFAPGFGDLVLARSATTAAEMEEYNPNYVGGDISGGMMTLSQVLARPTWRWDSYSTPVRGLYICSASAPPGPGVHGMCGYWAARSALGGLEHRKWSWLPPRTPGLATGTGTAPRRSPR